MLDNVEERTGLAGVGKYPIMLDSSVRKSSTGSTTTMGTKEDGPHSAPIADLCYQVLHSIAFAYISFSTFFIYPPIAFALFVIALWYLHIGSSFFLS